MTHFPSPFIVGAPRSGTTLLRMMIDAHPDLAIPPETAFIPELLQQPPDDFSWRNFFEFVTGFETWKDFHVDPDAFFDLLQRLAPSCLAEAVRCFYQLYAERFAKTRWGDKTPNYGLHLQLISSLLPEARFVHLIRDGRDVAVSIRGLWFAPSNDFRELGADWDWRVRTIREQGSACPQYLEVRFEELISNTAFVLRRICAFLELDFHPRMLNYYEYSPARLEEHESRYRPDGALLISKQERQAMQSLTTRPPNASRCGAWKTVLSHDEHEGFLQTGGSLLKELGYY